MQKGAHQKYDVSNTCVKAPANDGVAYFLQCSTCLTCFARPLSPHAQQLAFAQALRIRTKSHAHTEEYIIVSPTNSYAIAHGISKHLHQDPMQQRQQETLTTAQAESYATAHTWDPHTGSHATAQAGGLHN
eukprot:scaffold44736_cov20-Tisochrysis_lutea.AAC.2